MTKRDRTLTRVATTGLVGVIVLAIVFTVVLWRGSIGADERAVGGLANALGARAESMIVDARTLLQDFERLPHARCSPQHLEALRDAAMGRPHIRAIGFWRAADRQCGVGFLTGPGLRPPRADRIYDSGVVAWWPSPATEVGGIQLFLMRFGDHDVAIDPHALLDVGPLEGREAGLWVEGLRLTSRPAGVALPSPTALPVGLTMDRERSRAISRFSRRGEMPIDIVAVEPLEQFWTRYRSIVFLGAGAGVLVLSLWLYLLLRYTRYKFSRATQLREAIAKGRITAVYQPIIELATGKCAGAEILARWTTERDEPVPPDSFVALAEREGLVTDLTLAVLQRSLRELGPWLHEHPSLTMALNLGSQDLHDPRFAEGLEDSLLGANLPPSSFKLEITERALVDADLARSRIAEFRARGHAVAVDDFGTGYSSLTYLSTFALDQLKIDKTFVEAIGTGAATSHVVVHVIEMAQSLNLRMVAEGVEQPAQAEWLRGQGVEFGQGYHYSRPIGAEEFKAFVSRRGIA
ncbi:EAL domain-containing protein [Brevundimonas sp.]|uniref:EAL domain-containing protein n=1 Tax=Brevundimonas sp. TaxID=1871086 RepID=UPI0025E48129|nr:EAL domain-containing protein [Brevundimonas sp.]